MQINILNGNVTGAEFLEETDKKKKSEFRENLNERLRYLAKEHKPCIITLQEIIRYRKPHQRTMQDVFVVNVHLTTLTGEREGIAEIDEKASEIRLRQLDIVLNGIVSRYNGWRRGNYQYRGERRKPDRNETFKRHSPIWILCGDFNFTPESAEYSAIIARNFVDANPKKGKGTKGKERGAKAEATITCDYIFVGPKFIALSPVFTDIITSGNPPPFDDIKVSDHYPLLAEIPLSISLLWINRASSFLTKETERKRELKFVLKH